VYITDFLGGYFSILFLLEAIRDECWTGREREPIIDPRYSMLGPLTASQSSFSLCVCVCVSHYVQDFSSSVRVTRVQPNKSIKARLCV
jgi:hypothetical protein